MIDHFLITRWNIRVKQWRTVDKNQVRTLTADWMRHRFRLFEKYTLPSVRAQTAEFKWIMLADVFTPEVWKQRLESYPDFEVFYLTENWLPDLQAILQDLVEYPWIMTTRLDNDDAIHPDFMAEYQKAAEERKLFLNIPRGWKLKPGISKRPIKHNANHFMSFIELSAESKSIYFTPHGSAMGQHAPIKQVCKRPLWTQVIHERNYVNG